jgi:hypothetical protein
MSGERDRLDQCTDEERHLALCWLIGYDPQTFDKAMRSVERYRRPVEPMGVGAVVADARGHKFVRVADRADGWAHGSQWQRIGGDINAVRNFGWLEIEAVKVLCEGLS